MLKYYSYKILTISAIFISALMVFVLSAWLILSITAGVKIPESNKVDYVKGVWMPVPIYWPVAYLDLEKMKNDGINTISIGTYSTNHFFSIIQEPFIGHIVKKVHSDGLVVHLVPNSWVPMTETEEINLGKRNLFTKEAIFWAKFAEKYNIEYYSPQNEPDVILGVRDSELWAKEILPQIKREYNGSVVLKIGKVITQEGEPSSVKLIANSIDDDYINLYFPDAKGYDYLMIDIFPFENMNNNTDFVRDLNKILVETRKEADKQDIKGIMIGEFGYDSRKNEYSKNTMPGPQVSEEEKAIYLGEYLEESMPLVDGIIHYGWMMEGYGIRGKPAEEIVKNYYLKY